MAQPGDYVFTEYTLPSGAKRHGVRYYDLDRKRQLKQGFTSRGEAERWWFGTAGNEGKRAELLRGADVRAGAGSTPLSTYQQQWLADTDLAHATVTNAKSLWHKHIAPVFGDTPVNTITRHRVQTWVHDMAQAGVGYETRRLAVLHLGRLLTAAADTGAVTYVATAGVSPGKQDQATDIYVPTQAQARAVIDAVDKRDRMLVKVLALTGMRQGEAFALRVKDLNLDSTPATARVSRTVDASAGQIKASTKTGKARTVTLPAVLADELRQHIAGKDKDDLVFTSPQGRPIRAGNWRRRVWDQAIAKAQEQDPSMERFTPHELRHFYATSALAGGVPVFQVSKELGHTSTAMTQDVYARWSPEAGAAAADAAAAALGYGTDNTTAVDTDTDKDTDTAVDTNKDTDTAADADTGADAAPDKDTDSRARRFADRGVPPVLRRD